MKMLTLPRSLLSATVPLMLLAGCGSPENKAEATHNSAAPPPEITAIPEDQDALAANEGGDNGSLVAGWTGRWNGPEGLFLDIAPGKMAGSYMLTLKDNLDNQDEYTGRARGETIVFTRRGKLETLRTGSGDQTGFKYLAGKQDCLIVTTDKEGYCRD